MTIAISRKTTTRETSARAVEANGFRCEEATRTLTRKSDSPAESRPGMMPPYREEKTTAIRKAVPGTCVRRGGIAQVMAKAPSAKATAKTQENSRWSWRLSSQSKTDCQAFTMRTAPHCSSIARCSYPVHDKAAFNRRESCRREQILPLTFCPELLGILNTHATFGRGRAAVRLP